MPLVQAGAEGPLHSLGGAVERVTFASEESGYAVLRLAVPGRADLVTVVGNLGAFRPGEEIVVEGRWVRDPKYGRQFRAVICRASVPATLVGLERYLGSGLVRGVGRGMARRIVAAFGEATLDVLEKDPGRLAEVGGIGPKRVAAIREAWAEQRSVKEVMIFLQGHGISTLYAHRIWKTYRDATLDVVRGDPFRLAMDVRGIGFKSADRIAASLGIAPDSPQRARAALLHLLGEISDDGHVWTPREDLLAKASADLAIPAAAASAALADLVGAGRIAAETGPDGSIDVASGSLAACERGIASSLRDLLGSPPASVRIDVPAALAWHESRAGIRLAERQREAIARALAEKVLVVTGGPGTGKTTLLRGVLAILAAKKVRAALAAPTGRAAKRMTEATGFDARTIHRLLEFEPRSGRFARNRGRPVEADVVVVDEASMLDTVMAHHLLAAVPRRARLILVGDVDQLPSVGPGSFFGDTIACGSVPVIRLNEVFRQAASSWIVRAAHAIREGRMPPNAPGKGGDFYFIEEDPARATERIVRLVSADVPRRLGVDPRTDVQVLCPMNKGPSGSDELNDALREALNPDGREIGPAWRRLRVGDRVMQIRNDYDRDVFNGDLGRVAAPGAAEGGVVVEFDGRAVAYDAADLDELAPAYACSIHKAQGSEYPVVVVPLVPAHWVMLQRNLVYTAVTRARRLLLLVGSRRAFGRAIRNNAAVARRTRLAERIRGATVGGQ